MKKLLLLSLFALSAPTLFADIEDDEFVMIEDGQLEDEFTEVGTAIFYEDTPTASELIDWNFEISNESGNPVDFIVYKYHTDDKLEALLTEQIGLKLAGALNADIDQVYEAFYKKVFNATKHRATDADRNKLKEPVLATQLAANKSVRLELKPELYVVCIRKSGKQDYDYYRLLITKDNTGYLVITPTMSLQVVDAKKNGKTKSGLSTQKNVSAQKVKKLDLSVLTDF